MFRSEEARKRGFASRLGRVSLHGWLEQLWHVVELFYYVSKNVLNLLGVRLGMEGRMVRLLTKIFTRNYLVNDLGDGRVWLTDFHFPCDKFSVMFG